MRYKAKSIAALQLALGSLPDKMRVEVEPDIDPSEVVDYFPQVRRLGAPNSG